MEMPKVATEAKDQKINFTFRVMAYRQLTPLEFRQTYAVWLSQSKRNRPKRGQTVTIVSIIGA